MAVELGWSEAERATQLRDAADFLKTFGGPKPLKVRYAVLADPPPPLGSVMVAWPIRAYYYKNYYNNACSECMPAIPIVIPI